MSELLAPLIKRNDKAAKQLIFVVSAVVFFAVVLLKNIKIDFNPGFDVHLFATVNAVINSAVSILLLAALIAVKNRNYKLHRDLMLSSMLLSVVFLVSYILHHLLSGNTAFGGTGAIRYFYFFILITHIFLAAIILPFILFTAYRGMIAEFPAHRKLARITWPIWFYVSVTGVVVYVMISPYYT